MPWPWPLTSWPSPLVVSRLSREWCDQTMLQSHALVTENGPRPLWHSFCMGSKLLLVVDAHIKFEVSSFSRSEDIGARILKIWASSAILDSTLSEFWQLCSCHGVICPRAAELERCNRFSNCRALGAPGGQMDLSRVEGHSCTWSAADESPDIGATSCCFRLLIFCPIFKSERSECEWGQKRGKISPVFTPCEK